MSETSESEISFVRTASDSSRLLHSSSRWIPAELDSAIDGPDSLPSSFSKSVDFNLTIADKHGFKRCLNFLLFVLVFVPALVLMLHFLKRKEITDDAPKDLTLALSQALLFFDAQKSGHLQHNFPIPFRGNSGLYDGKEGGINADLVGGFYDSGNNVKFSFSTAYAVTLLSWTVVEYGQKYADIRQLDNVKEIIRWGSDYLLKLFIPPPNSTSDHSSAILYSQVGGGSGTDQENDVNCWQRPEDMKYPRPVSVCDETAADLAGEIIAGMSAASLVFTGDKAYASELIETAEALFRLVTRQDNKLGKYTVNETCGGQARKFYNSSGYIDELVWGGTWLFFATGNTTYLKYATDNFAAAEEEELPSEEGIFYWNNKLTATAILMTRIRYFIDLGYPYEEALSTNRTDLLMCSYLFSNQRWSVTNGGLIVLKPDGDAPLQYAATAAFLSKLYSDYLQLLRRTGGSCGTDVFSAKMLLDFSVSQVNYILGDNPMKMSYLVGYGEHYPRFVHHRAASIPWDKKQHSCAEGKLYLNLKQKNPNNLIGAMVGGPDKNDAFLDDRSRPWFTEPSISGNAGLVAALVALHHPPKSVDYNNGAKFGIDKMGMFQNVHLN